MILTEGFISPFLPTAELYKGRLLFSWAYYARWLQHLHLGQTRHHCELGWWEEPTSLLALSVPALAQYSSPGTDRVQHKRRAFSSWPRTGSSLSRQHGILWEDHSDCHSKPKLQQKMTRVQCLQRCNSYAEARGWTEPAWVWKHATPRRSHWTYRPGRRIRFLQRSILTSGCTGGLHRIRFKVAHFKKSITPNGKCWAKCEQLIRIIYSRWWYSPLCRVFVFYIRKCFKKKSTVHLYLNCNLNFIRVVFIITCTAFC